MRPEAQTPLPAGSESDPMSLVGDAALGSKGMQVEMSGQEGHVPWGYLGKTLAEPGQAD